uniref:acid-sensing ion channel 5-like isoform X2 n=1 Tax=Styela clava TaxID=7725 RepID=UPI00193AC680|nr:acid-sensing ion channel 5-like isoform X2 [Styela clava]
MPDTKNKNARQQQTANLISETDKEFVTSTSCHGISYFCTGEKMIVRITWLVLIAGMVISLVVQIYSRISSYFEYKTTTDISEVFVPSLEFPAITICSFNRYFKPRSSVLDLRQFHALNRLTSLTQISRNITKENEEKFDELGDDFNITAHINKYGFFIGPDIKHCKYRSRSCRQEEFTESISSLGKCFTFNKEGRVLDQNVPGAENGFSMEIDAKQVRYTEEPLHGIMEAGIKIQVHPRYEIPDVETFGIAIPTGIKGLLAVKRTDYNLMYEPWGRCNTTNEQLKYFNTYTLHNCEQECFTKLLIRQCGCRWHTQHWAKEDADECTLGQVRKCASQFLFELKQNAFNEIQEEDVFKNILNLEVYFNSMSYNIYTQSKKIDESGLLSDVGGQLGLWVGMSFITVFEFIQYFIKRSSYCCTRNNMVEDVASDKVDDIL